MLETLPQILELDDRTRDDAERVISRESPRANRKGSALLVALPEKRRLAGCSEERSPLVHGNMQLSVTMRERTRTELHPPESGLREKPQLFANGTPHADKAPVELRNMVGVSDYEPNGVSTRHLGVRVRVSHVEMGHADHFIPHFEEVVDELFDSASRRRHDVDLTRRNVARGHDTFLELLIPAPDEERNRLRIGDEEREDDERNAGIGYHGSLLRALCVGRTTSHEMCG